MSKTLYSVSVAILLALLALFIAGLGTLVTAGNAHARDPFSFWGGLSLPKKELSASYRLPVKGYDTRVYEWHPEGNASITCVAQFSESGPVGMQCFDSAKTISKLKGNKLK